MAETGGRHVARKRSQTVKSAADASKAMQGTHIAVGTLAKLMSDAVEEFGAENVPHGLEEFLTKRVLASIGTDVDAWGILTRTDPRSICQVDLHYGAIGVQVKGKTQGYTMHVIPHHRPTEAAEIELARATDMILDKLEGGIEREHQKVDGLLSRMRGTRAAA